MIVWNWIAIDNVHAKRRIKTTTNGATNHFPRMVTPGGATRAETFDDSLAEAMIIKAEEVMRWHADFSVTNEEKLEKFRTELQTSLKHFKGAFGELFK